MKTITHSTLVEMLRAPGNLIVGIDSLTDSKARKTGNPFGTIFKRSRVVTMVGANYEKAVNRQGEREGVEANFIAAPLPRPGDFWLIPNKVIQNEFTGVLYLRTETTEGMRRKRPAIVYYMDADGNPVSREDAAKFIPERKGSIKQEIHGVQGEVMVRDYKFTSILRLRINGETVSLVDNEAKGAIPRQFNRIFSKRPIGKVTA